MGLIHADGTAAAYRVRLTITAELDSELLYAATLFEHAANLQPNDTFALIGLMQGGTNHQNKIALLTSGYLGGYNTLGWTGRIFIDAHAYLFAEIQSSSGGLFTLNGLTWKPVIREGVIVGVDP